MARLPYGAIIGPYKIVEELASDGTTRGGAGEFGITYFARPVRGIGEPVAIKEFYPSKLVRRGRGNAVQPFDAESRRLFEEGLVAFEREAEALDRFKHPNLLKIRGLIDKNGTSYIVTEWIEGQELLTRVGKRGTPQNPLTVDELRPILEQLLDALEAIHSASPSMLHRDIKPSNILLRAADNSPVLIDFGAARQTTAAATQQLTTILTPGYAPYEQYVLSENEFRDQFGGQYPKALAKPPNQGPWTDIYALGATCYFALTGQTPGNSIMRRLYTLPYKPLETRVGGEPASGPERSAWHHFLRQIDRALSVEPQDRFQSAKAWRAALDAPPTGDSEWPPPGGSRVPLVVGGLALLVTAGIVIGSMNRAPSRSGNTEVAANVDENMTNDAMDVTYNGTEMAVDNVSSNASVMGNTSSYDLGNTTGNSSGSLPTVTPHPAAARYQLWYVNQCGIPIQLYVHWNDSILGWTTNGPWNLAPNYVGPLKTHDTNGIETPIYSTEPYFYHYGKSTIGDWTWSGSFTINGLPYALVSRTPDAADYLNVDLTCDSSLSNTSSK
jgi:serine/threonine protein kinase